MSNIPHLLVHEHDDNVGVVVVEGLTAGTVALAVDDDGPGVPADQRARILKRGERLDERTPGTGLGLSIVSDVVREYGGEVRLAESPLGGLRVVAILPRVASRDTG